MGTSNLADFGELSGVAKVKTSRALFGCGSVSLRPQEKLSTADENLGLVPDVQYFRSTEGVPLMFAELEIRLAHLCAQSQLVFLASRRNSAKTSLTYAASLLATEPAEIGSVTDQDFS